MVCKIIKAFYTDHIFVQTYRENKCCPQWGVGGMLCNWKNLVKGLEEHLRLVGSVVYFLTVFSLIFKKLPITIHPLVKKEKSFEGFSIF